MQKTILITGSTDGIGLVTATQLVEQGHHVLLHGRNPQKLQKVHDALAPKGKVEAFKADLSVMEEVKHLAAAITDKHDRIDVLINNAGVYNTKGEKTPDGLDPRFAVNTLAPYLLTQQLLPIIPDHGRIVNLSSAAQAPIDLEALKGNVELGDHAAYSQSKLAITMWSRHMAGELGESGQVVVAVNPGSLLASKMVKQAFHMDGRDINIGADILIRAALSEEFASASGKYYDNDNGQFAPPHPDGLDDGKVGEVVRAIESLITGLV